MNFVKRSSEEREIRGGVGASGGVRALLLPTSDLLPRLWAPTSLFCSIELTGRLTQGLCRMVQDLGAIAMKSLNVILSNGLADPLNMELLEL